MPEKELVTIATFNEPMVAHLAMGKLEAYGIAGYLGNEHIVGTQWAYANLVGGVQLQVEKADAQQAIAILNDKPESDSGEKVGVKHTLFCPKCESEDIQEVPKTKREWVWYCILVPLFVILTFAWIWSATGFWVIQQKKWKCNECAYEWKQRNQPVAH